eukprot:TRINITY_DN5432_c0_g3_i3.p1 TRINITY_DN5432_c0_g3~~TRINITY_DN5432_c0_g3_i3.p1  ORF type:complete len:228 (-),score=50.09 TRINITY_DN5432_c0_g3_i3:338-1021(-)
MQFLCTFEEDVWRPSFCRNCFLSVKDHVPNPSVSRPTSSALVAQIEMLGRRRVSSLAAVFEQSSATVSQLSPPVQRRVTWTAKGREVRNVANSEKKEGLNGKELKESGGGVSIVVNLVDCNSENLDKAELEKIKVCESHVDEAVGRNLEMFEVQIKEKRLVDGTVEDKAEDAVQNEVNNRLDGREMADAEDKASEDEASEDEASEDKVSTKGWKTRDWRKATGKSAR